MTKSQKQKVEQRARGVMTRPDGTRSVSLAAAVKRQKETHKFEAFKKVKVSAA